MTSTNKLAFLSMPAPENYVAGIGRGAAGFVTRSDLGPSKDSASEEAMKRELERRAAILRGDSGQTGGEEEDGDRFQDPENDAGLFASSAMDKEDEEAERVYKHVDELLERRRRRRRGKAEDAVNEGESTVADIKDQFAHLKRGLTMVTDDEWSNLPEVGDLTGKNRRRQNVRLERSYAVPDSVLAGAYESVKFANSIDPVDGTETTLGGTLTDFVEMGSARDKVLGLKLDQASGVVSGLQSSIDPKGYLTSLNSSMIRSNEDVGDIKKARLLLHSVTSTNPKNAPGWIAAARLEEHDGKIVKARELMQKGCRECATHEDVWLEAVRLNTVENGKIILSQAVQHVPNSVKIWLCAMSLENNVQSKKRVLRKALQMVPQSVKLWKEAVNLEDNPENARVLLARATELIPLSVELWLALARLETYDNAKKILNKARQAVRISHEFWIAAARLEEQQGNDTRVDMLISRGVRDLQAVGAVLTRDQWLAEAEKCEKEGAVLTCQAIVKATLGQGVEEVDKEATFRDDAATMIEKGSVETARAIFAYALREFPTDQELWKNAASMERAHGDAAALNALLEKAVEACPKAQELWLMFAREKNLTHNIEGARQILARAFEYNANNEDIWLAAAGLEAENGEHDRASRLLARARLEAGTQRVWIQSAVLEREFGNDESALELAQEGLKLHPQSEKLYMIISQILNSMKRFAQVRETLASGTKVRPKCTSLWLMYARFEERQGRIVKARGVLDQARLASPQNPQLWCETVRIELRAGNAGQAKTLMAKALKECSKSGILWAESIFMEPRPARRSRSIDAIRNAEDSPVLITAIARLFFSERKYEKGRSWFEKVVKNLDPDYGDAWAWYYRLEPDPERRTEIKNRVVAAQPRHGEQWQTISKDPKNARKDAGEILELVATSIE